MCRDYAFPPVYAGQELNAEAFYDTFLRSWVNEGGNIILILENHVRSLKSDLVFLQL